MKNLRVVMLLLIAITLISAPAFGEGGQEGAEAERMEIVWQAAYHPEGVPPEDGNLTELIIEEKFNVDIKPLSFPSFEARDLYFAAGNTADKITLFPRPTIYNFIDQGILREIPEAWVWQYMPDWMERMVGLFGRNMVRNQMIYGGKVYGAPYGNYADFLPSFPAARRDWMDNVGVTKIPETLDEFYDLVIKFTRDDPDGNGIDDTYGLHDRSDMWWSKFGWVFTAYGINFMQFEIRDGKALFTPQLNEWKEALRFVTKLYAEGAIDPEFVTDKRDQQRKKWANGKFGILYDNAWWMISGTGGNVLDMVREQNANAEFAYMGRLTGPDHGRGNLRGTPAGLLTDGTPFYGYKTSDEKVKKIMEIDNAFSADLDFYIQGFYGTEGVHWERVDGVIKRTREATIERQTGDGIGRFYTLIPILLEEANLELNQADQDIYNHAFALNPDPNNTAGVGVYWHHRSEAAVEKRADIVTAIEEFYYNVVLGEVDLDAEWDGFQETLEKIGIEEIKAEYETLSREGTL